MILKYIMTRLKWWLFSHYLLIYENYINFGHFKILLKICSQIRDYNSTTNNLIEEKYIRWDKVI